MAWFKVDDGLHSSRKLHKIPRRYRFAAIGLWTIAGSWASDELTDGFIPDYMLKEWGAPPAAPEALVDCGLWERTDGGYTFHAWLTYQPRKADVDAEREASRERMRDLRARRKQQKPLEQAEAGEVFTRTVTNRSENVSNPDPTRPDPNRTEAKASVPRKRGQRIPDDFTVTEEMRAWGRAHCPSIDGQLETTKFINYWSAKTGKDATKLDWTATWRNWMLNATSRAAPTRLTSNQRVQGWLSIADKYAEQPLLQEIEAP